jgi:general secretion pathway protein D/MSHA biogenesis protein MshL
MKFIKSFLQFSAVLLLVLLLSSCGDKKDKAEEKNMDVATAIEDAAKSDAKPSLPMQYQRPAYMIGEEVQVPEVEESDEVAIKVGATIRSTGGPQPLWDILKRLAAMKNMNISWESDVDRDVLVDVDISANDDYFKAIDNLLRQVDYFHEIEGNTIIVKYKETRQYQIGMPYIKQLYETGTGGNVLGGEVTDNNVEGTIRLDSKGNEFDLWANIEENLNAILDVWTTEAVTVDIEEPEAVEAGTQSEYGGKTVKGDQQNAAAPVSVAPTRRRSGNQNLYTIDKNVGMVTVTAPRPLLNKIDAYVKTLKSHLYKQITIEAKIIEVLLTDASSIGINWSEVLKNFSIDGLIEFGSQALGGQVYPYIFAEDNGRVTFDDGSYTDRSYDPTRFVSKIRMGSKDFRVLLNALKEEGQTKVLSNPKISVMNGQPALITVGRNVTYIDSVEATLDTETNTITYTVNTERILSGLGMAITATVIDDDEVIMNLVPVTSELMEPIEYREFGTLGGTVGLPIVNIREMSTTVKVKNGEMLVIGGLISDDKEETGEFLPILGDIPFVKYLFGFEEKLHTKRELIILLKPVVI